MILNYLGPEGSFSHSAALELRPRLGPSPTLAPLSTVEAVVRSVAASEISAATLGLVPYYNFLEGLVQEYIDLIYEFRLQVDALVRLPIQLAAGGFAADEPAPQILSHPKALVQVSEFVHARFKNAVLTQVGSTSDAARLVAERRSGIAIASEGALLRFGVPVLARDIGNRRHGKSNFTDLFVVKRPDVQVSLRLGEPNHALIAITPSIDRPGLLSELLGQFHFYDLDIAKIHSRPAIDWVESAAEPQMFYLEVKCSPQAEPLRRCAEALQYRFGRNERSAELVRVLGGFRV
jgi:prephenate dehydratase